MGKLAPSRKCMGNCAVTRQRIGMPRRQVSVVLLLFTEDLPDLVCFHEATAGNASILSDTVPGALFVLVLPLLKVSSSWSMYHAHRGPLLGAQVINVVSTQHKLYYGANNMKATSTLNIQYNYYYIAAELLNICRL